MLKKSSYTFLFFCLITTTPCIPAPAQTANIHTSEYDEFDHLSDVYIPASEMQPNKPRWYSLTQYRAVKKSGITLLMLYAYMKGKMNYYWQAFVSWLSFHIPLKYETVE